MSVHFVIYSFISFISWPVSWRFRKTYKIPATLSYIIISFLFTILYDTYISINSYVLFLLFYIMNIEYQKFFISQRLFGHKTLVVTYFVTLFSAILFWSHHLLKNSLGSELLMSAKYEIRVVYLGSFFEKCPLCWKDMVSWSLCVNLFKALCMLNTSVIF